MYLRASAFQTQQFSLVALQLAITCVRKALARARIRFLPTNSTEHQDRDQTDNERKVFAKRYIPGCLSLLMLWTTSVMHRFVNCILSPLKQNPLGQVTAQNHSA